MVPKKNRLGSFFFKNLFKKGIIVDNSLFSLKYIQGNKGDFKISVIISKKVSPKAVERNLIKRRFLSSVLSHKNLLKQGYSYVFYVKKEAINASFEEIQREIQGILLKIYEKN